MSQGAFPAEIAARSWSRVEEPAGPGLGFVDPAGEPDWRIVVDEGVHSVDEHGGRARESMFDGAYVVFDALISDGSRHHLGVDIAHSRGFHRLVLDHRPRLGAMALSGSPVVGFIDRLTAAVAGFVSTNPAVALVGLLLVGLGARWWITRSRELVAGPDSPSAVPDRHLAEPTGGSITAEAASNDSQER
jgi:hypothetical protein